MSSFTLDLENPRIADGPGGGRSFTVVCRLLGVIRSAELTRDEAAAALGAALSLAADVCPIAKPRAPHTRKILPPEDVLELRTIAAEVRAKMGEPYDTDPRVVDDFEWVWHGRTMLEFRRRKEAEGRETSYPALEVGEFRRLFGSLHPEGQSRRQGSSGSEDTRGEVP